MLDNVLGSAGMAFTNLPPIVIAGGAIVLVTAGASISLMARRRSPRKSVYGRQHYLFTKSEWPFMRALMAEFGNDYLIMSKVRIADVLKVRQMRSRKAWWRAFAMISSKHIDFVLLDRGTGRILCGIELDDPSHRKADRQGRDAFVNRAFAGAGLPLLRIPTRRQYDMKKLRQQVQRCLA